MPVDKVKEAFSSNKISFSSEVKNEVKKAAITVAENFTKMCICEGKKPATLAGVAIFMIALKLKTHPTEPEQLLQEISDAVKIGTSTIRECYQSVLTSTQQLLPEYLQSNK